MSLGTSVVIGVVAAATPITTANPKEPSFLVFIRAIRG
jgi:hypothetical protein